MLQNITLSAEKDLIERARQRAQAQGTTVNAEFRRWLAQYADKTETASDLSDLMERFKYVNPGKAFSRHEMNER
jgi:hypothetical protein